VALVAVVTILGSAAGMKLAGITEVVADEALAAVACTSAGDRVAPGWRAPPKLDLDPGPTTDGADVAVSNAAALVLASS
jgi:hypothetical protein